METKIQNACPPPAEWYQTHFTNSETVDIMECWLKCQEEEKLVKGAKPDYQKNIQALFRMLRKRNQHWKVYLHDKIPSKTYKYCRINHIVQKLSHD